MCFSIVMFCQAAVLVWQLTSATEVWFHSALGLTEQLQNASIEVLKPAAFEEGNLQAAMLTTVKRSGNRIVTLLAYDHSLHTVASMATHLRMCAGWAWLFVDSGAVTFEMAGWLFLQPVLPSSNMQAFAQQVSKYAASSFNISVSADSVDVTYSVALHDAIMLYAHAATKVLSEGGDLGNGRAVTEAIRSTAFEGVGGNTVSLDAQGDRIESTAVGNYLLGSNGKLHSETVAVYNRTVKQYRPERTVVWPGNTTEVSE